MLILGTRTSKPPNIIFVWETGFGFWAGYDSGPACLIDTAISRSMSKGVRCHYPGLRVGEPFVDDPSHHRRSVTLGPVTRPYPSMSHYKTPIAENTHKNWSVIGCYHLNSRARRRHNQPGDGNAACLRLVLVAEPLRWSRCKPATESWPDRLLVPDSTTATAKPD